MLDIKNLTAGDSSCSLKYKIFSFIFDSISRLLDRLGTWGYRLDIFSLLILKRLKHTNYFKINGCYI